MFGTLETTMLCPLSYILIEIYIKYVLKDLEGSCEIYNFSIVLQCMNSF